jgi:hypothetical protein
MSGGRRANRARKRHNKKQKMLNLMEGIKKKETVPEALKTESPLGTSCSEADVCNAESSPSSDVISSTVDSDNMQYPNMNTISGNGTERKEYLEPAGVSNINCLEKRKNEFSSLKRATKRTRTSSLSRLGRKDINWPKRNYSTSCLTSWLVAAEHILAPSPMTHIPKVKRSRDEVTLCSEDTYFECQPVKRTKSVDSSIEPVCSSTQPMMEMMEISPVLTPSNKRTRHNSAMNNSFMNEKMCETDDSPPILRPRKRTKSISGILPQISKESVKLLPECSLSSQKPDLNMTPTKYVTPPASPMTVHISAACSEHFPSELQLQLMDNRSNTLESCIPMDAQNKSLQKVCYLV